jgi:hypothetical protein
LERSLLSFQPEHSEKIFLGDSVENGFIRGKALENRVFDGNIRAPWGGMGRTWEKWGKLGREWGRPMSVMRLIRLRGSE